MKTDAIVLTAGHQLNAYKIGGGTGAKVGNRDEAYEARRVVNDIMTKLKLVYKIPTISEPDNLTLGQTIRWVASVATPKTLLLDYHFNAASPQATGTEIFIAKNHTKFEREFAQKYVNMMAESFGVRNRGVKTENQSQHDTLGILSGAAGFANNFLPELIFLTNDSDWEKYSNIQNYLKFIDGSAKLLAEAYESLR
jgi:hypothetical protein